MAERGEVSLQKKLSRRAFLRITAATAASFLRGCASNTNRESPVRPHVPSQPMPETFATDVSASDISEAQKHKTEKMSVPELVHGVEVYGLTEKITSEEEMRALYTAFDDKFEAEHGIEIKNKITQRNELLDPNERYLEVVVRQAAYDSFLKRQEETQVDFVDWIQMHVAVINRCFENAKPPCDMRSVLRRIVVITDEMPKKFWNEDKYRNENGQALDNAWTYRFVNKSPLDTDSSWAIADDYRVDTKANKKQGHFGSVAEQDGKTVFLFPPGGRNDNAGAISFEGKAYDRMYALPQKDDVLQNKKGVWLDFGLTHEWSHYLLNLPDEYAQDVYDPTQRFQHFFVDTGSFDEPYLSPFLSIFAQYNIENKKRNAYFTETRVHDFSVIPQNVQITARVEGDSVISTEIRRVRFGTQGETHSEGKTFNPQPDIVNTSDTIGFTKEMFQNNSNCWLIRTNLQNGQSRELYLPYAPLGMTKMSGSDDGTYGIAFTGDDHPDKKTQAVEIFEEGEIEGKINERSMQNVPEYARMKIAGTNFWMVWFLRE